MIKMMVDPYEGLQNGQTKRCTVLVKNPVTSDVNAYFRDVAQGGATPPLEWLQAAEVHFLLAEAALAGYNVGGTAQSYYESG